MDRRSKRVRKKKVVKSSPASIITADNIAGTSSAAAAAAVAASASATATAATAVAVAATTTVAKAATTNSTNSTASGTNSAASSALTSSSTSPLATISVTTTESASSTSTSTSSTSEEDTTLPRGVSESGIESMCNSTTLSTILPAIKSGPSLRQSALLAKTTQRNGGGSAITPRNIGGRGRDSLNFETKTSSVIRSLNSSPQRARTRTLSISQTRPLTPNSLDTPRDGASRSSGTPRSDPSPRHPNHFIVFVPHPLNLSEEPIIYNKLLGHGATANVYEATLGGVTVAVKRSKQEQISDAEARIITQKLDVFIALPNHPNILRTFPYRFDKERRLISISEKMTGTLRDIILQTRKMYYGNNDAPANTVLNTPPLNRSVVLNYFTQIVSGLNYLHHLPEPIVLPNGGTVEAIWHRDLKSDNIFYVEHCDPDAPNGNNVEIRLAIGDTDEAHIRYDSSDHDSPIRWSDQRSNSSDSSNSIGGAGGGGAGGGSGGGGSRGAGGGSNYALGRRKSFLSTSRERLSLNIGTIQYMAPEMCTKTGVPYNETVDIYSLGMILYELLTLELPWTYENYSYLQLYDKIIQGYVPMIPGGYTERAEWQPVVQLFKDCIQFDPKRRPSTIELLRRLDVI
jgi:serine/threonine protein kinase